MERLQALNSCMQPEACLDVIVQHLNQNAAYVPKSFLQIFVFYTPMETG